MPFVAKDIIRLHGFKIGLDKDQVSLPILRSLLKGWYEGAEVQIIEKVVRPGDRIIEMGTGIGVTAMKAAKIVGAENVLSFELNPYLIAWARDNFKRNDIPVNIAQKALFARGAMPGETIDFHVHENFWASSLVERDGIRETIQVPTACLEDVIEAHKATMLVVDIEGAEVALFEKLDLTGITKIVMEIHYKTAGRQATNAMIRQIADQGFFLDYELITDGVLCFTRDGQA